MISCNNCTVLNNFGERAGVSYTSNDGYIVFNNSLIKWNKSLYSSIMVMLSSPTKYSQFKNSWVEKNTLLSLSNFIDPVSNNINLTIPQLGYLTPDYLNFILNDQ